MNDKKKERRKSKRAFFNPADKICATIRTRAEPPVSLPVTLISISPGGFGLYCPRDKVLDIIKEGDQLTLTDINMPQPLGPIASIAVEVKYILDYEGAGRVGLGCNFFEISETLRNKIRDFVEYHYETTAFDD